MELSAASSTPMQSAGAFIPQKCTSVQSCMGEPVLPEPCLACCEGTGLLPPLSSFPSLQAGKREEKNPKANSIAPQSGLGGAGVASCALPWWLWGRHSIHLHWVLIVSIQKKI